MKRTVIFILFFISYSITRAQIKPDSCTMQISLLTCAPGEDLYSLFGHTAIRVQDARRGMDIVYNYGTFDDTDPLFYVNFTNGIMNYSLSAETMDSFLTEYQYEHRNVVAQILNLSCKEKQQLYESLRKNTLDENRIYQYHFHTDNCTTRAARIIESNTDDSLKYGNTLLLNSSVPPASLPRSGPALSFRDMIHEYLNKQHADWSEFGIDLFLGANLDAKVTNLEAIHFLPDYLYRGMDKAVIGNRPAVLETKNIIGFSENKKTAVWFTPVFFFTFLLILSVALFLFRTRPGFQTALRIFDILFFSVLGLIGVLMAYLWLGRVDTVCRNNINILWALPTHLIAVFFIRKKSRWIKYYFGITTLLATGLVVGFGFWPQKINDAVLPVLGIIIFRSFQLFQQRNHAEKHPVQRQAAGI